MHLLLVDGFNLIRRIYEARPHDDSQVEEEVVTSAGQSLHRALKSHVPTHACCVFDSQEKTWRHLIYPEYKQNRSPTPAPLLEAIPQFENLFRQMKVNCLCIPGYEADDVIATLAHKTSEMGGDVTVLSTDKGFLQLLDKHIKVFDHFNKIEYKRDVDSTRFEFSQAGPSRAAICFGLSWGGVAWWLVMRVTDRPSLPFRSNHS